MKFKILSQRVFDGFCLLYSIMNAYKALVNLNQYATTFTADNETYQFKFTAPCSEQNNFPNSTLGQAAKLIGSFLDNEHKYIEWKIEANLDAKGIDIGDSQKIYTDIALST